MQRRVLLWGTLAIMTAALGQATPALAEVSQAPRPGPEDRCPVCGMFAHKFEAWVASIVFADGSAVFFDGPKDMFRYYLRPEEYQRGEKAKDFAEIYVTDYYTTESIPARRAFFVVGSDVMGPMGKELVPVGSAEAAETFRRDHKGERVLAFDEIELSDISTLE